MFLFSHLKFFCENIYTVMEFYFNLNPVLIKTLIGLIMAEIYYR
jgi:hypothetical protein